MPAWTAQRMAELGTRHSMAEAEGRLGELLATLGPNPVYEFHPAGLKMAGDDQVRRFYEQFCEFFLPLRHSYELLSEWVSESSVAQEYDVTLRVDGDLETHRVLGVLYVGEGPSAELLGGERVYAPERFIRLMTGRIFDELTPL